MCTRYFVDFEPGEEAEEIREMMAALNRDLGRAGETRAPAVRRGEVFPSDVAAVLTAEGPRAMRWGFARPDGQGLVVNARSETLPEKPMFRNARRCLVPANHYYEWAHEGREKIKYRIGEKGRPIFMAGLYRLEGTAPVFCVLTRAPAADIAFIHDRMPVLLTPEARGAWLSGAPVEQPLRGAVLNVTFTREDGQISLFSV